MFRILNSCSNFDPVKVTFQNDFIEFLIAYFGGSLRLELLLTLAKKWVLVPLFSVAILCQLI